MNRRNFLNTTAGALSAPAWPGILRASQQKTRKGRPPNIVFILADDMGWGDLGCYGNRSIKTPNFDRLARQGALFTQFYVSSPVCSPSRTAFLTGNYPARHQIHDYLSSPDSNKRRGIPNFLDPSVTLIPRLMKQAGYATGHFGKWHLGQYEATGLQGEREAGELVRQHRAGHRPGRGQEGQDRFPDHAVGRLSRSPPREESSKDLFRSRHREVELVSLLVKRVTWWLGPT